MSLAIAASRQEVHVFLSNGGSQQVLKNRSPYDWIERHPRSQLLLGPTRRTTPTGRLMTLYEVLEVSEYASQETIRAAYRALTRKYHPDTDSSDAAQSRFIAVQKAYEVLGDIVARRRYDRTRLGPVKKSQSSESPGTQERKAHSQTSAKEAKPAVSSTAYCRASLAMLAPAALLALAVSQSTVRGFVTGFVFNPFSVIALFLWEFSSQVWCPYCGKPNMKRTTDQICVHCRTGFRCQQPPFAEENQKKG